MGHQICKQILQMNAVAVVIRQPDKLAQTLRHRHKGLIDCRVGRELAFSGIKVGDQVEQKVADLDVFHGRLHGAGHQQDLCKAAEGQAVDDLSEECQKRAEHIHRFVAHGKARRVILELLVVALHGVKNGAQHKEKVIAHIFFHALAAEIPVKGGDIQRFHVDAVGQDRHFAVGRRMADDGAGVDMVEPSAADRVKVGNRLHMGVASENEFNAEVGEHRRCCLIAVKHLAVGKHRIDLRRREHRMMGERNDPLSVFFCIGGLGFDPVQKVVFVTAVALGTVVVHHQKAPAREHLHRIGHGRRVLCNRFVPAEISIDLAQLFTRVFFHRFRAGIGIAAGVHAVVMRRRDHKNALAALFELCEHLNQQIVARLFAVKGHVARDHNNVGLLVGGHSVKRGLNNRYGFLHAFLVALCLAVIGFAVGADAFTGVKVEVGNLIESRIFHFFSPFLMNSLRNTYDERRMEIVPFGTISYSPVFSLI